MENIKRTKLLHQGKANNVWETNNPIFLELEATDRISAGNGEKTDVIPGKGIANNIISSYCFKILEEFGIDTHYYGKGSNDATMIVYDLGMIPLEVIVRRKTAGSFCKRYGCKEGIEIYPSGIEFCFKNDALRDPFIADFAIEALNIATKEEIYIMRETTSRVSDVLYKLFDTMGIELIDFKIEFGKTKDGKILVADEISPDTCRLVDKKTGKKLDKDLFRQDLGGIEEAYKEVLDRLI